jgi:putative Mn2+ efflux pump MntP
MDAFAVSIAYGITAKREKSKMLRLAPLTFGLFQGAMVTIGFFIASFFTAFVSGFANLIALVLLCILGGKMIFDAVGGREETGEEKFRGARFGVLMVQGLATSIDALAIGVSMSLLSVNIVKFALINCFITLIICALGVVLGKRAGKFFGNKAEIIGGIILIAIGIKIFAEGII